MCLGVHPVSIGGTIHHCMAKCVLAMVGSEVMNACGIDQLCAGLSVGIEGGIHAMQLLWEQHKQEENWGFLLIDAQNAFNSQNHYQMLWVVQHKWPSGAQFTFNCYQHWVTLIIHYGDGLAAFDVKSKEGIMQGDPIAMVCYGIGVLPLIRILK